DSGGRSLKTSECHNRSVLGLCPLRVYPHLHHDRCGHAGDTATIDPRGPNRGHGARMNNMHQPAELGAWAPVIQLVSEMVTHVPVCWRLASAGGVDVAAVTTGRTREPGGS